MPVPDGLEHELDEHLPAEAARGLLPQIEEAASRAIERFAAGNRVYTLGNGGACSTPSTSPRNSSATSSATVTLAGAVAAADTAAITCIANDYSTRSSSARCGPSCSRGDVVAAFTTSGRSPNVVRGLPRRASSARRRCSSAAARAGRRASLADHALVVPSESTARIQELHVLLLHVLLERIDAWAAGG